ncbi:hypothetical protein AB6C82_21870 [Vibrio splendidus]
MKFKISTIGLSIGAVLFANSANSFYFLLDEGEACKTTTLEKEVDDFQEDISPISEKETPIGQKITNEEIGEVIPEFETGAMELAEKIGGAIAVVSGGLELLDGIENKNADEITGGAVLLGSYIAPEIAGEVIGSIFSESIAEAINPVIGVLIAEGIAIYGDIKMAGVINKMEESDRTLMGVYSKAIDKTDASLLKLKKIIRGDNDEIYNYEYKHFGELTVELYKNSFHKLAYRLINDNYSNRVDKYFKDNTVSTPITMQFVSSELPVTISHLIGLKENLKYWYSTSLTGKKYISSFGHVPLNNANFHPLYEGTNSIRFSKSIKNVAIPNMRWLNDVFFPVLERTVDVIYDNSDHLVVEFKDMLTDTKFIHSLQESMITPYNDVLKKYYSWLYFGHHILKNLDYSEVKVEEGFLIFISIFMPIESSIIQGSVMNDIKSKIDVAPFVFSITKSLISQGVDVTDETKFTKLINDAYSKIGEEHSTLKNKIMSSYHAAKDLVNTKLVDKSEISLKPISQEKLNSLIEKIDKHVADGSLKKKVDVALNDAVSLMSLQGGDNYETSLRFIDYAQMTSSIQNSYFNVVGALIDNYVKKLQKLSDWENEAAAVILSDLRDDLVALNKNSKLVNYSSQEVHKYSSGNFDWLAFNSTPFLDEDNNKIIRYLDDTINLWVPVSQTGPPMRLHHAN